MTRASGTGAASRAALLSRLVTVLLITSLRLVLALPALIAYRIGKGSVRTSALRRLGAHAARCCVALGPAFVKLGQILATRSDLLPEAVRTELAPLRDDVPSKDRSIDAGVRADLASHGVDLVPEPVPELVGSGSIADVYRATVREEEIVAKIRRPGVSAQLTRDMDMLRTMSGFLARRVPAFADLPAEQMVGGLAAAVERQADLDAEAAAMRLLGEAFENDDTVVVPRVHGAFGREDVLLLDYLPGLRPLSELVGTPQAAEVAEDLMRAVFRMIFIAGIVHCDLHEGNLYTDASDRVVIVDGGFTVRLSPGVRERFRGFFVAMSLNRGARCADLVIESADDLRPGVDFVGFRAAVADLVRENHGRPAAEFELPRFIQRLFSLQRRFGIFPNAEFVYPLLTLLMVESQVRALHPTLDFQAAAVELLITADRHRS